MIISALCAYKAPLARRGRRNRRSFAGTKVRVPRVQVVQPARESRFRLGYLVVRVSMLLLNQFHLVFDSELELL